jgi:lipopolysaccharide exporter
VQITILARLLTPGDFGLMAIVMMVVGYAQTFTDMGISNAVIHHQDTSSEQLSSLYWLNIFAGIAVFFLTVASTPLAANLFHEPRLYRLIPLAAVIFLIVPFGQEFQLLLQKKLQFRSLAIIEISSSAAGAIAAIFAGIKGLGVVSLIVGQLSSALLATIIYLVIGLRNWRPDLRFRYREVEKYVAFGLFQLGNQTLNFVNARADQIMIAAFVGPVALGYYSMAWNLTILPVSKINPILTRVAFPLFAKFQHDQKMLKRGYMKLIWLLTTINAPISIGSAITAPLLVSFLYGPAWTPSVVIVQILAPVGIIRSIINPVGSLFLALGRADLGFYWSLKAVVLQVICVYLGGRLGGLHGVIVGLLFSHVCYFVAHYPMLIRVLIGPCLGEYLANVLPSVLIALVMGIIVWVLGWVTIGFGLDAWLNLGILSVAGAITYFVLNICFQRKPIMNIMAMLYGRAS